MDDRPRTDDSLPEPVPPPIVDGEEHRVDPRSVKVARIIGISVTCLIGMVPSIAFTLGWALGSMPNKVYVSLLGSLLLILGSFLTLAYRWPALRHKRLSYLVDKQGLRIRRGVLWRKVICISISRVQHTDFTQGPVQRRFDLATLTVHTAGTAGAPGDDLVAGAGLHDLHTSEMGKRRHEQLHHLNTGRFENHVERVVVDHCVTANTNSGLGRVFVRQVLQKPRPHVNIACRARLIIVLMLGHEQCHESPSSSLRVNYTTWVL